MEVCNSVYDQLVYIAMRIHHNWELNTPHCLNCCSSVIFSITITYFVTFHALSRPLDNLFTINMPAVGEKV